MGSAVASLLTACGSGSGQETPALMRVVNLTSATVAATLSDTYDTGNVPAAPASGFAGQYIQVPPGTYSLSVYPTANCSGTCPTEGSTVVGLGTGDSYTTVAFNRGGSIYTFTLSDNLSQPENGAVSLAAANMSPDAGPVDIFLIQSSAAATSVGNTTPTFPYVNQVETVSVNFQAGKYDIFVTGAGVPTDIRLHITGLELAAGTEAVLALSDTSGGSLVNGALIEQGEGAVYYQNGYARVRLFNGISTASTSVAVTIPGATNPGYTTLAGALPTAPTGGWTTAYIPVDLGQGDTIASITVGGTPLTTLPTTTLASGQDYTVLVYGTAGAPVATVLTDDNFIASNQATVRLINAGDADAQQMRLDGRGDIEATYGSASDYFGFTPYSPDSISIVSGDYNETFDYAMVVGNVYTVFVYSLSSAPVVTEDR